MHSAQGELASTLDYTYRHPQGHEITLSSADGQNVSGIKYQFKPPKPQVMGQPQGMQKPPIGNIFAQNAKQPMKQPMQQPAQKPMVAPTQAPKDFTARPQIGPQPGGTPKQDFGAYAGGPAPITGQGRKQVVNVSVAKGVPMGPFEQMGGPGTFCDMCHVAISTWVPYKGLRLCRNKCWARVRPVGVFVRK